MNGSKQDPKVGTFTRVASNLRLLQCSRTPFEIASNLEQQVRAKQQRGLIGHGKDQPRARAIVLLISVIVVFFKYPYCTEHGFTGFMTEIFTAITYSAFAAKLGCTCHSETLSSQFRSKTPEMARGLVRSKLL